MRTFAPVAMIAIVLVAGCTEDDTIVSVNFEGDPIDDLSATITTPTTATLHWTAPSAGGTTAASYRIRYREGSLDAATWDDATPADAPPPNVPDADEQQWLIDLPAGTTIAVAVRYTQGAGVSDLSNVVTIELPPAPAIPDGFVYVPADSFTMGSPADERGHEPDEALHRVTLTRAFFLGRTEVTQSEYQAVTGENPSVRQGSRLPVQNIDFLDAVTYCNARSAADGLTPAYTIDGEDVSWDPEADGWRLPTEAEWEYACRAGSTTALPGGDPVAFACDLDFLLSQYGIYCGNDEVDDENLGGPSPVGGLAHNAWGLLDMHGNVFEWCWDWYQRDLVDATDPRGPETGVSRVTRGGAWSSPVDACRAASRSQAVPDSRNGARGFRLARTAPF
jgi:formylglycine-generating enzyme required for sulfatase activity